MHTEPMIGEAPAPLSTAVRDFGPLAESLRDEVARHYEARGEQLSGPAGQITLDTNSTLVERRGALLLQIYRHASGRDSIEGLRVLDVGCGFGALALFFASRGATVVAVDRNQPRMEVGAAIARRHELSVEFLPRRMEQLELPEASFDLAVHNNSLCYVIARQDRARALREAWRILRPGGLVLIRNPNRWSPVDRFSGLPFVALLPPRTATRIAGALGRRRSLVRIASPFEAKRELRRAGFVEVKLAPPPDRRWPAAMRGVARYQNLVARRPRLEHPG